MEDDYKIESSDVNYKINEAEIYSDKKTSVKDKIEIK